LPSRYYKNTRSVLKIIESDEFSKNYFINVRRETDINKKKKNYLLRTYFSKFCTCGKIFVISLYLRPYSPTPVNVNCRLKCFVTLVTYCYNNIFVYFNLQPTPTGVGEYGPKAHNQINKITR
jgi:hypothetical protein